MDRILIDVDRAQGAFDRYFGACIGSDYLPMALRDDFQEQLALVRRECGFRQLRSHGALHDDMGIYGEDAAGRPRLDFAKLDRIYDRFIALGTRPVVGLNFPPKALASGPETMFAWRGNVTKPNDYGKWEALIRGYVRHCVERYGADEVARWHFEVWNEPHLAEFWPPGLDEYFHLYGITARAVKEECPGTAVGGPNGSLRGVEGLIAQCAENRWPLDFISVHLFAVGGRPDGAGGWINTLMPNDKHIPEAMRKGREMIARSPLPDLPLIASEVNSSWGPRDPIHDTVFNAAYMLEQIKNCRGLCAWMSHWTASDIMSEAGFPDAPFHGGFGLLTHQGIKKPCYHLYHWLHQMDDRELATGHERVIACGSTERLQVLAWRFAMPDQKDEPDNTFYSKELPSGPAETMPLVVSGLSGQYRVEAYRLGHLQNDPYSAFLAMGSPKVPDEVQMRELLAAAEGKPESVRRATAQGELLLPISLRVNEIGFMKLTRM